MRFSKENNERKSKTLRTSIIIIRKENFVNRQSPDVTLANEPGIHPSLVSSLQA